MAFTFRLAARTWREREAHFTVGIEGPRWPLIMAQVLER